MNRSFLELLEAEKRAFLDAKYSRESVIDFLNKAEMESNPEKRESCKRVASEYENRVSKAEEELLQIRKEMKQYISFLETL